MRQVNPYTQCEIIKKPRIPLRLTMMMAMFGDMGFDKLPKPKIKNGKPEWYYIDLNKKDSKLSYEDKQELRRLKWTLKSMDSCSAYHLVMKYKYR